jgi:putative tryptophan/tyrosine transport system substrate-binding protein
MKRREFIAGLGATGLPVVAQAQQSPMPVIGVLGSASPESFENRLLVVRQDLRDTGYVEGRNVALEFRWAYDQYDRLPGLAADLVRSHVSLIMAIGNRQPALAAKSATTTIPIVFTVGADPQQFGLVSSLNRPGRNITGVTALDGALIAKRLQLLNELIPNAKVFGLMINPDNNPETSLKGAQDAVQILGGKVEVARARTQNDFNAAFASLAQKRVQALSLFPDSLFAAGSEQLVALAARHVIPTIYFAKFFAKAGGLMTYGADPVALDRQAGVYAGRILKGEGPGDLPVVQPTKFEFAINLKTAKTLGLTIPPNLLALADEVIE